MRLCTATKYDTKACVCWLLPKGNGGPLGHEEADAGRARVESNKTPKLPIPGEKRERERRTQSLDGIEAPSRVHERSLSVQKLASGGTRTKCCLVE